VIGVRDLCVWGGGGGAVEGWVVEKHRLSIMMLCLVTSCHARSGSLCGRTDRAWFHAFGSPAFQEFRMRVVKVTVVQDIGDFTHGVFLCVWRPSTATSDVLYEAARTCTTTNVFCHAFVSPLPSWGRLGMCI
jgi:hypothetical protein